MTVVEILDQHAGLVFARCDNGAYVVGICYTLDTTIDYLNPHVDFACSENREVVEHVFHKLKGT